MGRPGDRPDDGCHALPSACLCWGKGAACPGPWSHLHVFRVVLQTADEFAHWLALIAHFVHRSEQGEPREKEPRLHSLLTVHPQHLRPPCPDSVLAHHFPSLPLWEFSQPPVLSCYRTGI